MAIRAFLTAFLCTCLFVGIAKCEFYIIQAPSTMTFAAPGKTAVPRSELTNVVNFMIGLPSSYLQTTKYWPGLESFDVFNPPEVNVLVTLHVPAGNDFNPPEFKVKYHITNSEEVTSPVDDLNFILSEDGVDGQGFSLRDTFKGSYGEVDMHKLERRLAEDDTVMSHLPSDFSELGKGDETKRILGELQMLSDAADQLVDHHNKQSVHVLLTALNGLAERFGATSPQVKAGIRLYEYFIQKVNKELSAKFGNKILIEVDAISEVVPSPFYLTRRKRSAPNSNITSGTTSHSSDNTNGTNGTAPDATQIDIKTVNLATPNSENYPVTFNIVLWLMIGFFLAVLAAAYSIGFMDPGRDSVIYRATTQRMKSD